MQKLHLNYDGFQDNGVIFNDLYPNGVMFFGSQFKPTLSFEYHSFGYTEVFELQENYVVDPGTTFRRPMTDAEATEIVEIAKNWVQALGQEGNPTDEQKAEFIRYDRNKKLSESDWTQLSDSQLSEIDKASWITYRQALRDITVQEDFPNAVVWPDKP